MKPDNDFLPPWLQDVVRGHYHHGDTDMTYTDLEKTVYNCLIDICWGDYSGDAAAVSKILKLPINTVKGVFGSLTKKDMIVCEEEKRGGTLFSDIYPVVDGEMLSFGCDKYHHSELVAFKL